MDKFIIYFLLVCFISSCDPGYHADIINNTNQEILLEIQFDKSTIQQFRGHIPCTEYLRSYPDEAGFQNIRFDPLELKSTFILKSNSSFPVEHGLDHKPRFWVFKSIKIFYKDTIQLKDREEIKKAFLNVEGGAWELRIK